MKNYIDDLLIELIKEAEELALKDDKTEFENGQLLSLYQVISKSLNKIEAFNIEGEVSQEIIDYNPDSLIQ